MSTEKVVFDHNKNTTQIEDGTGRKFLEQDGNMFTNAEFQRCAIQVGTDINGNPIYDAGGKWIPEPKYIEDFFANKTADEVMELLKFITEQLKKIADVLPALDMYAREAIARAQVKDKSFNKLKGELGSMKRELAKYDKLKKLASVKSELAKLEDEVTEDGKQD